MKVFILGGKGFVGSAMVRECKRRGWSVQVVDKDEYSNYVGQRCDLLINANGNSKKYMAVENPEREFELSFNSVQRSIQDFPCDRYVLCSTADVYTDTTNPENNTEDMCIDISEQSNYGFHKYLAEQFLRHYHPNWMIIRFGGFVGPNMIKNPIFDILNDKSLWVHPESEMQYLNTDIAAGIVTSLVEREFFKEIFNVCGSGMVKLADVIGWAGKTETACTVRPDVPVIKYLINIDKTDRLIEIPKSVDMVKEFVEKQIEESKAD